MKRAFYICVEGTDGVGKTTQVKKLVSTLRSRGYKVLETKEPGTDHLPITKMLRGIMLDNSHDEQLTMLSRELISQAIRSIHLEKLVIPSLDQYDFIVQDRGMLSCLAYGVACGNDESFLDYISSYNLSLASRDTRHSSLTLESLYDLVVYLRGNPDKSLDRAKSLNSEFGSGDAMESRGHSFMREVASIMERMLPRFNSVVLDVDCKTAEQVHSEVLHLITERTKWLSKE